METFKITTKNVGETFVVRPLLNAKNVKVNILSYKVGYNSFRCEWMYRHLCFALVNGELKIFNFDQRVHDLIFSAEGGPKLLLMNSNKAIKINVNVKDGFLDNQYEIIEDDKYKFDNTDEKRRYIEDLFKKTDLDLLEDLKSEKSKLSELKVQLPKLSGGFSIKTMQEIYDLEIFFQ